MRRMAQQRQYCRHWPLKCDSTGPKSIRNVSGIANHIARTKALDKHFVHFLNGDFCERLL